MKTKQKLNSLFLAGSVLILFLILFSSTASASTINVKKENLEMNALQNAINKAHSGDIIKVAEDSYFESVSIKGKSLTIQGSKLPTVMGFDINGGSTTIKGFHIIKDGIYLEKGCARVMNNVFDNSQYGLYVTKNAFNKAKGCPIVSKNTFTGCETAIYIDVSKNPGKLLSFNQNKFKNCGVNITGSWRS